MKQVQVRNSCFSDKLYYSVIVHTCFKNYFNSLIHLLFIGAPFIKDTLFAVTDFVFAVLAVGIGLTGLLCYYFDKYQKKTKILAMESNQSQEPKSESEEEGSLEDSTDPDEALKEETMESNQSQEPKSEFEEEGSLEDSTDSDEEKVSREMENDFRDLVFDQVLARIVDVDGRTFRARFCESDLTVTCYLRPELYSNLTRPLVGGLVRLEYSSGFGPRVYYIIELINSKIKEASPWTWNAVFAKIIGEYQYEEEDERILYASLEPGQVVPCKVFDHLGDAIIQNGDMVYLEVNEKHRSFYKIIVVIPE